MIYSLEFLYAGAFDAAEVEEPFMEAVRSELGRSELHGLMIWPDGANAVTLIVEGVGDARGLAESVAPRVSTAGSGRPLSRLQVRDMGEPPAEIDALAADERWMEIVRMATPAPGATCGRCDAVLPPHEGWCPWGLGGPDTTLEGSGNDEGGSDPEPRKAPGRAISTTMIPATELPIDEEEPALAELPTAKELVAPGA
jgi:hypothetical protein